MQRVIFLFLMSGLLLAYQPQELFLEALQKEYGTLSLNKVLEAGSVKEEASFSFPLIQTGEQFVRIVLASSKPTVLLRMDSGEKAFKKAASFAQEVGSKTQNLCQCALIGKAESTVLLERLGIKLKNPTCGILFYNKGVMYELAGVVSAPVLINFIKNQCNQSL